VYKNESHFDSQYRHTNVIMDLLQLYPAEKLYAVAYVGKSSGYVQQTAALVIPDNAYSTINDAFSATAAWVLNGLP